MSTGTSGGWVARYSMISDSGWDMSVGEGILLILPLSVWTTLHTLQVHMNVLLFVLMISLVQIH